MRIIFRSILLATLLSLIVGCGGGGDSSPPSSSTPTPPPVQTVNYTVTASIIGTGGSVNPTSQTVVSGSSARVTLTPDNGYIYQDVSTSTCGAGTYTASSNTYNITSVTTNCSISFKFEEIPAPQIIVNGTDLTNEQLDISLIPGSETSLNLVTESTAPELTIEIQSSENVNATYDLSDNRLIVSATINAAINENESIAMLVTDTFNNKSSTLNINVNIVDKLPVTAFCLKSYCYGETPRQFTLRNAGNPTVLAHFQGVENIPLEFAYEVNSDFGAITDFTVRVTNVASNSDLGFALVEHNPIEQTFKVNIRNMPYERLVSLAFNVSNGTQQQSKTYNVAIASYTSGSNQVLLSPLDTVQLVNTNTKYRYELSVLDDFYVDMGGSRIELIQADYLPQETFGIIANTIKFEHTITDNVLEFELVDSTDYINQNPVVRLSPISIGLSFRLYDAQGNRLASRIGGGYTFFQQGWFLIQPTQYDYSELLNDYRQYFDDLVKVTQAELELDNLALFWHEVFESRGYETLQGNSALTKKLQELNGAKTFSLKAIYDFLYSEKTPTLSVYKGLGYLSDIDEAESGLQTIFTFLTRHTFSTRGEYVRERAVLLAAAEKIALINYYINTFNQLNNTTYGLIEEEIGFNRHYPRYLVEDSQMYSFFVGNPHYGEYIDNIWVFNDEYSYLNGTHNATVINSRDFIR